MIDKVIYVLSEGFRKEGLLVPFGTVYRIAEDLITMQNECSKELCVCKDCKYYEHPEYYGGGTKCVCRLLKRQTREYDFCSYGERKTENP
jgi:hypothetical protein